MRDRLVALRESGAILEFRLNCVIWTNRDGAILTVSVRHAEALVHLQTGLEFVFADYRDE